MKVFISADIEGIGGIVHPSQTDRSGKDYDWARGLMMGEVNAAVAGAFDAGANQVVVNDSHGDMRNLLVDSLDPRAELISGSAKPLSMVQGIEAGYDLAFFVGYHAMAGTMSGAINHTYYGADIAHEIRFNGERVGEVAINAAVAGHFGVPVGLVTGDAALAAEAKRFLGEIETAIVKEGVGRYSARLIHPDRSRELIHQAASRAVRGASRLAPYYPTMPLRLEIDLANSAQADRVGLIPGVERAGDRTVAFTSESVLVAYQAFLAMLALATTAK